MASTTLGTSLGLMKCVMPNFKLAGHGLARGVDVHPNDLVGTDHFGALNHVEANAAQPEHSDVAIHVASASMEQVEDAFSVICHCLLYALRRRIRQAPPSDNLLLASTVDAYQE